MMKNCLAEQLYILLFARQSKSPIANNIYIYRQRKQKQQCCLIILFTATIDLNLNGDFIILILIITLSSSYIRTPRSYVYTINKPADCILATAMK
jgi:hypothetical protein